MATENAMIMKQARESLSGRWGLAVWVLLVFTIINSAIGYVPFAPLLLGGPLALGLAIFSLSFARKEEGASLSQLFKGFAKFESSLVAFLLMMIFTLLWALLLIIPGIIAAISYSQTFYIFA